MRKLSIVVTALCVHARLLLWRPRLRRRHCVSAWVVPRQSSAVVDSFAGRVLKDDRVNKKFAKSDANRLVTNLKGQIGVAANCPGVTYKGKNMKNAHKNMGVTEGEFNAVRGRSGEDAR